MHYKIELWEVEEAKNANEISVYEMKKKIIWHHKPIIVSVAWSFDFFLWICDVNAREDLHKSNRTGPMKMDSAASCIIAI